MSESIRIHLNGKPHEAAAATSVHDLIVSLDLHPEMIVVERNRTILRRDDYAEAMIEEGDVLELVHFVGGG